LQRFGFEDWYRRNFGYINIDEQPPVNDPILVGIANTIRGSLKHWDFNTDAQIFDLTWWKTSGMNKSTFKWNKLLRDLGYIGIYDNNNSIIHPGEPFQMVALSPEAYEVVGFYTTADIRKPGEMSYQRKRNLSTDRNTPAGVLNFLSKDSDSRVRADVAAHRNTPAESLRRLSADPDVDVRRAVARNNDTPIDVIESLVFDKSRDVRRMVVHHPHTSGLMLRRLYEEVKNSLDDERMEIRKLAGPGDGRWEAQFKRAKEAARGAMYAVHMPGNREIVDLLVNFDKDRKLLSAVAGGFNTPTDIIDDLATQDLYMMAKQAAIGNSNISIEILQSLMKDPRHAVMDALATSSLLSIQDLAIIAQRALDLRAVDVLLTLSFNETVRNDKGGKVASFIKRHVAILTGMLFK